MKQKRFPYRLTGPTIAGFLSVLLITSTLFSSQAQGMAPERVVQLPSLPGLVNSLGPHIPVSFSTAFFSLLLLGGAWAVVGLWMREEQSPSSLLQPYLQENSLEAAGSPLSVQDVPFAILSAQINPQNQWIIQGLNAAFKTLTGWTDRDWVGRSFQNLIHPEDRDAVLGSFSCSNSPIETRILTRTGQYLPMEIRKTSRSKPGNGLVDSFFLIDLTSRDAHEKTIQAELEEKDILLKEVHHRIKNNLQVLVGLFSLQANQSRDPEVKEAFRESQTRVRSMALVHESLYRTESTRSVNMQEYLDKLARSLFSAYAKNPVIQLSLELDPVLLPVDLAIPTGLIVNELMTNAMKYAFQPAHGSTLHVSFKKKQDQPGTYQLIIKDDGVGMPPQFDWQHSSSLGLQLVNLLAHQMHGSLLLEQEGGTTFSLSFSEF